MLLPVPLHFLRKRVGKEGKKMSTRFVLTSPAKDGLQNELTIKKIHKPYKVFG